jgi:FAD dependent oxidoreductase TIGR03364
MRSAIVVGAGIVGLAVSRALALKGYSVEVFERNSKVVGASIRNFGMVWPIGQPEGKLYDRAMRSRNIWAETCSAAGIWHAPKGSVHVVYKADEWQVLQEFESACADRKGVRLLSPKECYLLAPAVNPEGLIGGLYSPDEVIVDPRQAIAELPRYFSKAFGIRFHFGKAVSEVQAGKVRSGKEWYEADEVFICSGEDFETLYPEVFAETAITKCKLQMLRTVEQPDKWEIGLPVCGGLTLTHYSSFKDCPSLPALKERVKNEMPAYVDWGIHVMISQNELSEVTIGDSHEYASAFDPFIRKDINDLILSYLKTFATLPDDTIAHQWMGVYPKMTNGATEIVVSPEPGVTIVNGLGGAGMSLSFGLAEEVVNGTYQI